MVKVFKEARKQGLTTEFLSNGHVKVTRFDENGNKISSVQVAESPNSPRGVLNNIARMRAKVDFVWKGH